MPAQRTRDIREHSMEVRTDAPSLPQLAIISPTPRTLTFPNSHSLNFTPYSTPSNSPFEPDLNSLDIASPASSYLPTPPASTRTPSPDSTVSVFSPSSDRGSESFDAERRPKKDDGSHIKRPENAFILFRRKCCEDRQQAGQDNGPQKKQRQADLSKTISQKWKNLSEADRQYWEDLAKEKKREHQEMYPGYVYRPQRARDKDGRVRNKKYTKRVRGGGKARQMTETDEQATYVVPFPRPISSSAPPVAYHTVHIPVVLPRLSCTSSPTHSHAIGRQTSAAGTLFDFDYFPGSHSSNIPVNETGLQGLPRAPLWIESQADCEPSQSSDLMRSLFSLPTHDLEAGQPPPPTSEESSPISGPVTPSSVLLNHPTFAQLSVFDHTLPSNFNVQIATPSDMNPKHSSYPWDTNAIWQGESSMLMNGDFDLNAIPRIEFGRGTTEYTDDSSFGIAPIATLSSYPMQDFPQGFDENFLSMDAFGSEGDLPRFDDCVSVS
ncbi:hypothetical protein GYMLUDRAFT_43821 [Collybiopsis luxurians FD-317 M1]|uniref:HMG box domain-containing protein n=1 Tax=Collybiopsis luxurians FD-317 M1 TaxID=944289 RepID=A0A0D0CNW8_9AGAR|nr:hypothetical protein GYMLUDRAFT_43821 [Collybiopsis luxurians FD-317 M1]